MNPEHTRHMSRALELARKGLGRVSPNPVCGCVIVAGESVVGEGYHDTFGGPHAEVVALDRAGDAARGATLYVTLEPCRHIGKTPPCTDAILARGVAKVVYAMPDPNREAAGGAEVLKARGIAAERMADEAILAEASELYSYFYKHVRRNKPFLTVKWAMSADGRLGTRSGDSHWITSEASRARGRLMRAEHDALIVGIGTVLRDDPRLSARAGDDREPLRVIVDSSLRTPPGAELFTVAGSGVLIACAENAPEPNAEALQKRGAEILRLPAPGGRVSLEALLDDLHQRGKLRLMSEGGGTLLGAAFDGGLVDYACVFMAPKVIGGKQAPSAVQGRGVTRMSEAYEIGNPRWEHIGPDAMLMGTVGVWSWMD